MRAGTAGHMSPVETSAPRAAARPFRLHTDKVGDSSPLAPTPFSPVRGLRCLGLFDRRPLRASGPGEEGRGASERRCQRSVQKAAGLPSNPDRALRRRGDFTPLLELQDGAAHSVSELSWA
jgi:hypothetical protein